MMGVHRAPGCGHVAQILLQWRVCALGTGKSSGVMAALHTVLATNSRMYCKAPNSEDLQRSQLLGKTTPKLSTPVLRLRTEKFAVR